MHDHVLKQKKDWKDWRCPQSNSNPKPQRQNKTIARATRASSMQPFRTPRNNKMQGFHGGRTCVLSSRCALLVVVVDFTELWLLSDNAAELSGYKRHPLSFPQQYRSRRASTASGLFTPPPRSSGYSAAASGTSGCKRRPGSCRSRAFGRCDQIRLRMFHTRLATEGRSRCLRTRVTVSQISMAVTVALILCRMLEWPTAMWSRMHGWVCSGSAALWLDVRDHHSVDGSR